MNTINSNLKAELMSANALLRTVIDENPNIILMKDWDGKFLIGNRALAELYGTTPDALVGKDDGAFNPNAEQVEFYLQNVREIMSQSETKIVMEESTNASTGETYYYQSIKKPLITADGKRQILVIANDVTELKRTQQRLEESERRLRYVLDATREGVWDWDITTGMVTHNLQWCKITGMDDGYLTHPLEDFSALLHEDDKGIVYHRLHECMAGRSHYQSEHRMRLANNKVVWVLDRGDVVERDAKGEPLRMVGSFTDISDRKAVELALSERTVLLKAVFDLSPDGFVSFNDERRVTFASPAFTRLTGIEESVIIGLNEKEVSQRLADICIASAKFSGIDQLRASQKSSGYKNGQRQKIELLNFGQRVLEIGLQESKYEAVSQILYLRDVTHETAVDLMKSEFLTTAAHELRTPMASIYGYSELMLNNKFTDTENREFLTTIYKQSEIMVSIINELLDIARIEARRGKDFTIERIQLGNLLYEICAHWKVEKARTPPQINLLAAPIFILGDRSKLTQAISNILANAYKYSPNGGAVSIEIVPQSGDVDPKETSTMVGIRITDQGIGMTPEQRARVFERFYRADTSGKIPGTGLGMSIVHEIVELHGGGVIVDSQIGKGTSVTIWLEIEAATNFLKNPK